MQGVSVLLLLILGLRVLMETWNEVGEVMIYNKTCQFFWFCWDSEVWYVMQIVGVWRLANVVSGKT